VPALLQDHPPLSAKDQQLLIANLPPELVFDGGNTARVDRMGIPGRLWVGEARLSGSREPSLCLYYYARSQTGLTVLCFSNETYRRGRTVEAFDTPSGTVLVGLVPDGTKAAAVTTATGASSRLAIHGGVYARLLRARPRTITVVGRRGTTQIDFTRSGAAIRPG
jgi:hypothetical protein